MEKPSYSHTMPARIALIYGLAGALWIFFSDALLHTFIADKEIQQAAQSYKGIAFVLGTTLLLYVLMRKYNAAIRVETMQLRKVDAEKKSSEQLYRSLVEHSPNTIFINKGGHVDFINPAGLRLLRANTSGQVIGKPVLELFHPDDHPKIRERVALLMQKPLAVPLIEEKLCALDGTIVPVDVSAVSMMLEGEMVIQVICRDVTERENALAQLRESEARYRELFEANPHPMWLYDIDSLEFLAVNDAALAHYGYSMEEFRAMRATDIRPEEDRDTFIAAVAQFKNGIDKTHVWRHQKKNGDIIHVECSAHALNFAGRNARMVLVHDITRRLEVEADIRRLNIELEARVAQRTAELEAKNRELETFTYSVSHDLKAPLRGIDGYSRLLLNDYAEALDDEGRLFLQNVCQATAHMSQLIDDLLTYSRIERRQSELVPVDLQAVISSVTAERAQEIQSRKVNIAVDLQCGSVVADRHGLVICLRNLIDNALKFTPESGASIDIATRPSPQGCLLSVRDNGRGFDPKFQDRIFEIFQRLHRAEDYPGTGIGLAIVRKAMERMGGRAWADSIPGEGATFYLEIPRHDG